MKPQFSQARSIKVEPRSITSGKGSGDLFDYHFLNNKYFIIYLIDVAGTGEKAALLAHSLREELQNQKAIELVPDLILRKLNKKFQMQEHEDLFFTIWYGVYNKITSTLCYATGGHHPAILIKKSQPKPCFLKTSSTLMGVDSKTDFCSKWIEIAPQDTLYLFSDGVFEQGTSKNAYGDFAQFLEEVHGKKVLDEVEQRAKSKNGKKPFADDFTFLQITF